MAEAEKQAACMEKSAADVCKAYRESQLKAAVSDAEKEYAATITRKTAEAKEYCTRVIEKADVSIGEIVGRIVSGDC